MSPPKKCGNCGGELKLQNIKGTTFPWKNYVGVTLKYDFEALRCVQCQEIVLSANQCKPLDILLKQSLP